jgi:hypothetical protein
MREIDAFETRNKFVELLGWVETGGRGPSTHGKEVARLVSCNIQSAVQRGQLVEFQLIICSERHALADLRWYRIVSRLNLFTA